MNVAQDRIMLRVYSFVFPVMIAVLGWMLISKVEDMDTSIREVGTTLEKIRTDVAHINQRAMLLEQKVEYRFEDLQEQVDAIRKEQERRTVKVYSK
jgi:uncharacterized protein YoxC